MNDLPNVSALESKNVAGKPPIISRYVLGHAVIFIQQYLFGLWDTFPSCLWWVVIVVLSSIEVLEFRRGTF